MEKFIVMGGKRLEGNVRISGAKNATLPIMAASLLTGGTSVIYDVPRLKDVEVMKDLLTYLGARIQKNGSSITIDTSKVANRRISEDLMRRMRASNLVMGPLLSRFGCGRISYPGACDPTLENYIYYVITP